MKTTLLIAILTLGLLPGLHSRADAQHHHAQSQIYISGYQRCGTPIYMVRYLAGYDCHGRAVWRVRPAYASELNRHRSSCNRSGYTGYRGYSGYAGYGQSRITYTASSGRGNTTIYYSSGLPSRCGR